MTPGFHSNHTRITLCIKSSYVQGCLFCTFQLQPLVNTRLKRSVLVVKFCTKNNAGCGLTKNPILKLKIKKSAFGFPIFLIFNSWESNAFPTPLLYRRVIRFGLRCKITGYVISFISFLIHLYASSIKGNSRRLNSNHILSFLTSAMFSENQ
jgi:hypothetical protein